MVEPQAGIPLLMQPLSGNSSDGQACGHVMKEHIAQLHTTDGSTSLVADSALSNDENLQHLAKTPSKWITRVPATVHDAQAALAHAAPQAMQPLTAGYRYQALTSHSGGVAHRWLRIASAPRPPQARHTVDTQRLRQSEQAGKAWKKWCGTAFACAADAQQALTSFTPG
jgi:transposase